MFGNQNGLIDSLVSGFRPVSLHFHQTIGDARNRAMAPTLIGIGLGLLTVAAWWPIVPVVTAMAIIALGSTEITISRLRDRAAFVPLLMLHGATYAVLYILFLGATLNAVGSTSSVRVPSGVMPDLAASALPMGLAIYRIAIGIRQSITPTR